MEWLGILAVLAIIVWLGFVIYSAYRDSKKITVDNEFALRLLPAGRPLPLTEGWVNDDEDGYSKHWEVFTSRALTLVDARIAYESYQQIRDGAFDSIQLSGYMSTLRHTSPELFEKIASTSVFYTLYGFIEHVALFDSSLKEKLKNRTVDPSEYELDKSGWNDEDEKTD